MLKSIVVYESKYGNTRTVAEKIAEGMNQVTGIEAIIAEVRDVDISRVEEFDVILIGSPNHVGGATRRIKKFIDELGKLDLKNKNTAVFDTYIANWDRDFEKVVKKLEKQIAEKIPGISLVAPGLSVKVDKPKGPITEGEIPKCQEFGKKIAELASV